MTECVLVDIDGTLADCSHRIKFVQGARKDWKTFFRLDLVSRDRLIEPVAKTVLSLDSSGYSIIYVSGRNEALRETTEEWLARHGLWINPYQLFMRADGDYRSDVEVKSELLDMIREEGWKPFLAIDDRSSVVSMWRSSGLVCLQAAEGDF